MAEDAGNDEGVTGTAAITCPNCGASAAADEPRCPSCSLPLQVTCAECGSVAPADEEDCPACGTPLTHATVDL